MYILVFSKLTNLAQNLLSMAKSNKSSKKVTAKPTAKKAAAKPVAKKVAAKPVAKKAVAKPVAKKVAAKPIAKKAVAKPVAKKVAAKQIAKKAAAKPVAKKVAAKPVAKKAVAKPLAKKAVAKPVAKKVAAKPVAKKAVAKPVAKKVAAKPVAKKAVAKPEVKKVAAKPVAKKAVAKPEVKKVAAKPVAKKAVESAKQTTPLVAKKSQAKVANPKQPKAKRVIKEELPAKALILLKKPQVKEAEPVVDMGSLRYSDTELKEFKAIVDAKLGKAREQLSNLKGSLDSHTDSQEGNKSWNLEEGSDTSEMEYLMNQISRQNKFIRDLEMALVRIENRTYGICRATGKLISKERLRIVPHATLSIDAKLTRKSEDAPTNHTIASQHMGSEGTGFGEE